MGLDITAYEKVELTEPHQVVEACWEYLRPHIQVVKYEGMEHAAPDLLEDRCYRSTGRQVGFRAGSYGGYNQWREALCQAALGFPCEYVWANAGQFVDSPFYKLVNFSDCEGALGPQACTALAEDFEQGRETVRAELKLAAPYSVDDHYVYLYDQWDEAFHLAAGKGLVQFH